MKVVLVNGSRRDAGCTYTALSVVAKELEAQGIETEIVAVGSRVVKGELDAVVKEVGAKITDADGLIVGSPVYYASPTGEIMMFLDRLFGTYGNELRYKCGSSIASARRGGTTSTVDVLNKYFQINQMPVVSSNYWNIVHGNTPDEVVKDEEGMQTMRLLGQNFAWLVKSVDAAKKAGKRVIAVGTTSCRTLESASTEDGILKAQSGWTDIFIYPGYHFKMVDALITNFHLPKSTLVMLVSALAGREHILAAYKEAVEKKYRFFSFGDAMFIVDRES